MSSNGAQSSRPEVRLRQRARVYCVGCVHLRSARVPARGAEIGIQWAYIHGTLWLRRQRQNVRTRAYHSSEFLHDRQLHNPPESPNAHVRAYIHTGHVTPTVFARTHCADRPDPRDEMDHSRAQPTHVRRQLRPLYVRFGPRGQAGWVCRSGPMQQRGRAFGAALSADGCAPQRTVLRHAARRLRPATMPRPCVPRQAE
jgi:hypothetical protein